MWDQGNIPGTPVCDFVHTLRRMPVFSMINLCSCVPLHKGAASAPAMNTNLDGLNVHEIIPRRLARASTTTAGLQEAIL